MRTTLNLNDGWNFSRGLSEPPAAKDSINVSLPHTWNAKDGQDGGNDYYRGTCLYTKRLDSEQIPQSDEYYLEIKAANSSADVYMGGQRLAHHDGGYSLFRVRVTDAIKREDMDIAIAVDNSPNDTVYPQMADFTFYGGLYRGVDLVCLCKPHFDMDYYGGSGIAVTPIVEGGSASVKIELFSTELSDGDCFLYEIHDAEQNLLFSRKSREANAEFKIDSPKLWHGRKNPYLYTATASILSRGRITDRVSTRFGCRSFKVDAERGFVLNGEEYALRGVSRHQDRLGIGNALLPHHHEEDIRYIMELGATAVRLAHYQQDQYFYDLCDECGLVVYAEIPYISRHMPHADQNTEAQMTELIIQNYNHPSIVIWGLSNEITMNGSSQELLKNHEKLNELAHRLDKTRLTTVACVSMCKPEEEYLKLPDLVAYNHYFGWYGGDTSMMGPWFDEFHKNYPNTPIGVSEYGCEALNWHSSNITQGDYTEEYQAYYHEELIKQLFTRQYLWGTYVWNMFDFGADARAEGGENGQNHKGLMTMDRKYKKDAFYAYKAWLSDEPFVHICGKRYVDRVEGVTRVTVYSNLSEVELFVNGMSVGKKTSPEHFFYFEVENRGQSHLVAIAGSLSDSSVIRKADTPNDSYILKEKNAVLNWFDITAPEDSFSLRDKISDIINTNAGKVWLAGFLKLIKEKSKSKEGEAFAPSEEMLEMLGGFTVLRLSSMLGMMNAELSKEELLSLNAELNQIKRP